MSELTIGSLCTGYGGLDHAAQEVFGGDLAWVADNNPGATKILAHRHPGAPNLGDITGLEWAKVARVDIATAGFPCQPFSAGGPQLGTGDERHLWPHLAAGLRTLQPALFVGENVPRLLTIEHGTVFGQILADLTQAGYTTAWTTLGACRLGFCQHRHRVIILAAQNGAATRTGRPIAHLDGGRWLPDQVPLFDPPNPVRWPPSGTTSRGAAWSSNDKVCDQRDGLLPTPAARDATRGAGWGGEPGRPLSEVLPLLDATARYAHALNQHTQAVGRTHPALTVPGPRGGPRPNPRFLEWMHDLPDGWVSDTPGLALEEQVHALGNGVIPRQIAAALHTLRTRVTEQVPA